MDWFTKENRIEFAERYFKEKGTPMVVVKHNGRYDVWTARVFDRYADETYQEVYRTKGVVDNEINETESNISG